MLALIAYLLQAHVNPVYLFLSVKFISCISKTRQCFYMGPCKPMK